MCVLDMCNRLLFRDEWSDNEAKTVWMITMRVH